jgi:hypothetical protein
MLPIQALSIVACLWFGCPESEIPEVYSPEPNTTHYLEVEPTAIALNQPIDLAEPEPVAQSTSQSANRGMGNRTSDVEEWRPLVAGHFNPEDVDMALCLMSFESGGNPNAKNPRSSARGLMQIMASVWAEEYGFSYDDLYTPEINLFVARKVKDTQGWGAWAPYNRGECR